MTAGVCLPRPLVPELPEAGRRGSTPCVLAGEPEAILPICQQAGRIRKAHGPDSKWKDFVTRSRRPAGMAQPMRSLSHWILLRGLESRHSTARTRAPGDEAVRLTFPIDPASPWSSVRGSDIHALLLKPKPMKISLIPPPRVTTKRQHCCPINIHENTRAA